jgi:toxin ParE1/3/4
LDGREEKNREDPGPVKAFQFSDPAAEELAAAVRWYEQRRSGWGGKMFDAVTHAIEQIQAHPQIGTTRFSRVSVRQFRVQGFPYRVAYRLREDEIYVVAVAHTSRRPGYWKGR